MDVVWIIKGGTDVKECTPDLPLIHWIADAVREPPDLNHLESSVALQMATGMAIQHSAVARLVKQKATLKPILSESLTRDSLNLTRTCESRVRVLADLRLASQG